MNIHTFFASILSFFLLVFHQATSALHLAQTPVATQVPTPHILAQQEYSLQDRYKVPSVNTVFADNILLTLSYMDGQTKAGQSVDWEKVRQPDQYTFVLQPNQTFAFHDKVEEQYKNSVVQTTNAHFSSDEKFKSDGWLVGDGVCHLASFINVVSSRAGLAVNAPTNHNFAAIPDVDKKFGTAIYYDPNSSSASSKENLYVTNNSGKPIAFVFQHTQDSLNIAIEEVD
jgi:hypothetical protein